MKLSSEFARTLNRSLLDAHRPLESFLKRLGETPLLELPGPADGTRIFAKCEWHNPTGSVKDRPVFGMLYKLLEQTPRDQWSNLRVLEYTGGSLGVALSRLCAKLGLPLTLVMSAATAPELLTQLSRSGSEVILVPKEHGFWGVLERARQIAASDPSLSFLYQHENPANLWMHRETTGREIAEQLPRDTSCDQCAWVASIGTGCTLMGVYDALVNTFPKLELFATSPAELPYGTERPPNGLPKFLGSGGFGCGRRQSFVAPKEASIIDYFDYTYEESLRAMREFYDQTGIRIGSSAAANWRAACEVAATLGPGTTVMTVFPSAATEYEWRRVNALSEGGDGGTFDLLNSPRNERQSYAESAV